MITMTAAQMGPPWPMTAAQMLHERYVKALRQALADSSRKRTRREREALQAKLDEALAFERQERWIVR